jgi:excisionase family DNA binding protein
MSGLVLLTIKSAAEILAVHHATVRRLIKTGQLPYVKVASCIRLRPADLEAYLERCAGQAADHEESTCKSAKETKTEYSSGRTRHSGGPAGPTGAAERLAARLGFERTKTQGK